MSDELATAIIAVARRYAGKKQETSQNRGPMVDEWLAYVGITSPQPWCAAFACWCVRQACEELHVSVAFRRSAGALRLLEVNHELVIADPEPGALVVWDHERGRGHVGIVTGVTRVGGVLASFTCLSGNSNEEGSRDADSVVERGFPQPDARKVAGYIRVA